MILGRTGWGWRPFLTVSDLGKTAGELAIALKAGTSRFHVESPHELAMLDAAARAAGAQADVLLRVNPPGIPGAARRSW